jgi:hypothetical protein
VNLGEGKGLHTLVGGVVNPALVAPESISASTGDTLQDAPKAFTVHARLTDVMDRLVGMNATVNAMVDELKAINENATTEFDQLVSSSLLQALPQFSILLGRVFTLRLEFEHLGLCQEKTLLGLQNLFIEFSRRGGDLIEVAKFYQRCSKILCGTESFPSNAD